MIVLPYPPTSNHIWRHFRGRVYLSGQGRDYRDAVALAWKSARVQGFGRSPLRVRIDAWLPDHRRRDVDNLNKSVLDALQRAGAFVDDSQIIDLHIRKAGVDKINPRIVVHLEAA